MLQAVWPDFLEISPALQYFKYQLAILLLFYLVVGNVLSFGNFYAIGQIFTATNGHNLKKSGHTRSHLQPFLAK